MHKKQVDQILLAGQSSRFPVVADELRELAGDVSFVKDDQGKLLLKECVSQGALMLVGQQLKIEGENRLWTRLGYIPGAGFVELVPWGSPYPFSSPTIAFTREDYLFFRKDDQLKDWLVFEIYENTDLDGTLHNEGFCRFRIPVDANLTGAFSLRLQLDEKGQALGYCKFPGEAEERMMEFNALGRQS
jgi:hypothetical protein